MPLQTTHKDMIGADDVKVIFGQVTVLLGYNTIMLSKLEKRMSEWSFSSGVGDIFLFMVLFLFVLLNFQR